MILDIKIIKTLLLLFLPYILYGQGNQTPAFPGAEGGGKFTTGGRGGKVIYVTSLGDTNTEGTLRWAINQKGARTILFKVSGIIDLTSNLKISNGDLTIAGQSAPGDGICIRNYSVRVDADNLIIRYLRFRMGDEKKTEDDAIWGRERKNIILDHCSMSWSTDECASFYDNENFTMQWCILSESLRNSVHLKGSHGYGAIWGGHTASFHHNLLAHHDSRNPRMCGSRYSNRADLELVDFRNNVIYNWGANSGYAGEGGHYNFINNYYKPGPASKNRTRIFQPYADDGTNKQAAGVWGTFFVDGNYVSGSLTVTNDNWQGIQPQTTKNKEELKSSVLFKAPEITTHSAVVAYDKVREFAGASLFRDLVDTRIVREVTDSTFTNQGSNGSNSGLIDSQTDVGGWPVYNTEEAPQDSNSDGIPDGWLEEHYQGKQSTDLNEEGYTYLEVYLNSLVEDITRKQKEDALLTGSLPVSLTKTAPVVYYDLGADKLRVLSEAPVRKTIIYTLQGYQIKRINTKGVYIVQIEMEDNTLYTNLIVISD